LPAPTPPAHPHNHHLNRQVRTWMKMRLFKLLNKGPFSFQWHSTTHRIFHFNSTPCYWVEQTTRKCGTLEYGIWYEQRFYKNYASLICSFVLYSLL
jgi:hypothetical protein